MKLKSYLNKHRKKPETTPVVELEGPNRVCGVVIECGDAENIDGETTKRIVTDSSAAIIPILKKYPMIRKITISTDPDVVNDDE